MTSSCKEKQENLVSDKNDILDRWVESFYELMNGQLNDEFKVPTIQDVEIVLDPPSIGKVKMAIRRLKHNRSPGLDEIATGTAELCQQWFVYGKLIRLTRITMTYMRSKLKVNRSLLREFHVNNGLR